MRRSDSVAVAMVVGSRRSAPRPLGAKMAINNRGEIVGGVSGGCVEGAVVEIAERVMRDGEGELARFAIADEQAWGVGLPCGGEIDVWVQRYAPTRFVQIAAEGGRAVEVSIIEGADAGRKMLVEADGTSHGSLGSPEADDLAVSSASELLWSERSVRRGEFFYDVAAPRPRLIAIGAIDIASVLCTLARAAGWRTYVVDPRSRFATRARFPDAEQVIAAWPEQAFAQLGGIDHATSVVVLSHDPKLDDAALALALRSPARFIGAMGSRHAAQTRSERLQAAGFDARELRRLSAPVGLDLGAESSEETALSILGEVVAARHDRPGGRLSVAAGRIHSLAA
jgi:xanthine dehydrogenase accessory factor